MKSEKKRWLKWTFVGFLTVLLAICIWLAHGFATVKRNRLKYALNLSSLPKSVKIVAHAEDIWTDYIVHFSCELDPADLDTLLSGRDFTENSSPDVKGPLKHRGYWSHLEAFEIDTHYRWQGQGGTQPPDCDVYVNAAKDEIYVNYGED